MKWWRHNEIMNTFIAILLAGKWRFSNFPVKKKRRKISAPVAMSLTLPCKYHTLFQNGRHAFLKINDTWFLWPCFGSTRASCLPRGGHFGIRLSSLCSTAQKLLPLRNVVKFVASWWPASSRLLRRRCIGYFCKYSTTQNEDLQRVEKLLNYIIRRFGYVLGTDAREFAWIKLGWSKNWISVKSKMAPTARKALWLKVPL